MKDPYEKQEKLRYSNPVISREAIVKYLEQRNSGSKLTVITKNMDKKAVKARIQAMIRDGQITFKNNKYFALPSSLIDGYLVIRADGFGLISTDGKDIILPPRQVLGLARGDFVRIRATQKKIKGKFLGILVEAIKRSQSKFIAEVQGNQVIMMPGQIGGNNIMLTDNDNFKNKQKVFVQVTQYPTPNSKGKVRIIQALDNVTDVRIWAALMHGLPIEFPEQVKQEADKIELASEHGRKDLTQLPFVTIDGADAKDFDDAIYAKDIPGKGWTLYVAIADVSAYVKPGTALDEEARMRATSVYFPGQVIPMLPEVLSNNLCSLMPNVNRAVMLAELSLDLKGKLKITKIYRAIIRSHARFTYNQVSGFMVDQSLVPEFWTETFCSITKLCAVLERKKIARGALILNRKEQVITLDNTGKVSSVKLCSSTKAHTWIELCMLEANEAVAKFLINNNLPGIYREHGEPKPDKYQKLVETLKIHGINVKSNKEKSLEFQALAQAISESDMADSLIFLLLRSLPQATYTSKKLSHFGLAYEHYCHFTSPIRRYPDLWVHRVIADYLDRKNLTKVPLSELAKHCSFAERKADYAAREVCQRYLCESMQNQVGKAFLAKIISVHSFGFFVALDESGIEGLVHVSNLPKDKYFFYDEADTLMGQFSGNSYSFGARVEVLLQSVNLEEYKLEFVLK